MSTLLEGCLEGLEPEQQADASVRYRLAIGGQHWPLTDLLGRTLRLTGLGGILCLHCGEHSDTSQGGGFCRRCFLSLPACDRCFRSPEHCHHHLGTCRDPAWGESLCMAPHVVYLAETSGLKVGITRPGRMHRRWLDQGAVQARPWLGTRTRRIAGEIEAALRAVLSDRTDWRQMLRRMRAEVDLTASAARLDEALQEQVEAVRQRFGDDACTPIVDDRAWRAQYPVPEYGAPSLQALRVTAAGTRVTGRIIGAKGRYLVLDTGVLNTGSHAGMRLRMELDVAVESGTQSDLFA